MTKLNKYTHIIRLSTKFFLHGETGGAGGKWGTSYIPSVPPKNRRAGPPKRRRVGKHKVIGKLLTINDLRQNLSTISLKKPTCLTTLHVC
jgi:hypothetical protein